MNNSDYPLQHISIRVPWHDKGWNGTVCDCPSQNTACLKLRNIFERKDENAEKLVAGASIKDLKESDHPPCTKERGTFMADFSFTQHREHPYTKNNKDEHRHFKATPMFFPAYSAAGLPFRWMNRRFVWGDRKKGITALVDRFPLDEVDESYEPGEAILGFKTDWLQDYRNHRTLLDCFWNHVRPEESLVFFYAKQIPLVEDTGRRVIIGVGRVRSIGSLTEYEYNQPPGDKIRSLLWERMVVHSIRPEFKDGFLMPYHEALNKSDNGRAFDPEQVVAFAPEDRFDEFSYATEHVGHDAAINTLLACRAALIRASELFDYDIRRQEQWIDNELGRLWKRRGPYPGMGAVLTATGVELGNHIAQKLNDFAGEQGNPWEVWDAALDKPDQILPAELARGLDTSIIKAWKRMHVRKPERRSFLELLSRIDLTAEQAEFIAIPEERSQRGINLPDSVFLENPYLIFEATRLTPDPVSIGKVDRGVFPTTFIRKRFPLPEPTEVKTAVDARRLRALVIRELESAAGRGDTLMPRDDIISRLRSYEENADEERTPVTADLIAVAEEELFGDEVRVAEMADGQPAYQLDRLSQVGKRISDTIRKRIQGKRHELSINWRMELDVRLNELPENELEREKEEQARKEKSAALAEIAGSRFSVLIGSAGTGKTTLLSVLCQRLEISQGGILLLAPTGKARVRLESVAKEAGIANYQAFTLAQFLARSKRYDGKTGRYLMTGEPGAKLAQTVIVDECSMMTEEMVAALLESVSGVQRMIFVGDPRQLPPIGAGRPFVDIVAHLAPDDVEERFPRIGQGYAELTIPRRQESGDGDDLQLAAWFGGGANSPGEDSIYEILTGQRKSDQVSLVQWETPQELEELLPQVLCEVLEFDASQESWQSFAVSLGGNLDRNGSAWFNSAWGNREGAGKQAEAWQILSPVRQKPWGVDPINRLIHTRFKGAQIEQARNPGQYRKIPKPMSEYQIVYGDKVINNRNATISKKRIYPVPEREGYLANGEIGIVVGHRRTKKRNWKPDYMEVEFSTQPGQNFKFWDSDFDEEGDANLELAYALTVHKSQGSEFGVVFLVLPSSPLLITRELLYTALTRQRKKIVVLHQGAATDLHRLTSNEFSSAAGRLTNLFRAPIQVKIGDRFLERNLIHVTARGEAVRSKSEVIVADQLHAHGIEYHYEHPLELAGVVKYPDFTIEDEDSGITYYWEHCGMLTDPDYRRRWEEKKAWYRGQQILPHQEGGGPNGTLIESRDSASGGISSQEITNLIKSIFQL